MFKIRLLNEISDIVYDALPQDSYQVGKNIADPDAIIVRSADMLTSEFAPSLTAVARAGVGYNNVPVERLSEQGVAVFFSPGANANAVKELVMAGLLLATRDIVGGIAWAQTLKGEGDKVPALVEKGKGQFVGPELEGKTLGVLGLGAIGGPVATLATHLHMNAVGFDPYMTIEAAWSVSRAVKRAASEMAMVAEADYLTLHVPLTKETRGKIDVEYIAQMKPGATLLNFSRGEIVKDQAVLDALASGHLRAYVTDFPNETLLGQKGVIAIPHLGASTPESEENCARMAAEQLNAFLTLGAVRNSVNLPACELSEPVAHRVTVVHKNIPNMISQIASGVAAAGINISDMVNRSRSDLAYTVLDLDQQPPADIAEKLDAIDGIIKVRIIR